MIDDIFRWILTALFVVVAVIGFLFITRGTSTRRVRSVDAGGAPVAPCEPAFPVALGVLTGGLLVPGNRVELALNGDGTYERLWADLASAQAVITMQMYYASGGRVADRLREVLVERARAGVEVMLLFDAFGAEAVPRAYWKSLREAGIQAVAFRPLRFRNLWVVQNRSHIRGIAIDARVGWTGGFGIDDKWLGNGRRPGEWRETNVRIEGPAVLQLVSAFVAAWSEATGELLTGRATIEMEPGGVASAGVLHTSPTLGSTAAERYLALSIAGARERLWVTNAYFAPDKNFVALLVDAARRGVDVRILVGGPATDVRVARLAAHAKYEVLLSAGVRVWEYQDTTLHAKTFVVDGEWVSIGTMNFDNRSLALNDEVTLMILDPAAGRVLEAVFEDDLQQSEEIDLATFRQRPWFEHVKEWGANQITRVL